MSTTSARLGIPIVALTDSADAHVLANQIVASIDLIMAADFQGLLSARPTSGNYQGKYYYATDTGALYRYDGSAWQLINPFPTIDAAVGTGSLRTIGTGPLQAASGADARLSDTRTPSNLSVTTPTIVNGAVVFSKMGFATPIALQKVSQNGTGFTAGGSNAKAGRILGPTDFTTLLGMTAPRILLAANGTTTDTSGNAVTVTNNGSTSVTGTDCSGLDGVSGTAFRFDGQLTWLTAPNTMKQKYGTWGCWIQDTQPNWASVADSVLISMWQAASSDQSFRLVVEGTTGLVRGEVSTSGGSLVGAKSYSLTRVNDGAWHFVAMSWDGSKLCIYVDGVLEGTETVTLAIANPVGQGPLNQSAALLLGVGANGNGGSKYEGKMSNVFVTQDVLDETAIRSLYAKKYAHGLATQPELYILNVRKYFRSKTYVAADFTGMTSFGTSITQPLMGGNMENTTWVNDYGSLGLSWSGGASDVQVPYPFQGQQGGVSQHGAMYSSGASAIAQGSDTGLPSGAQPTMSYGLWFRCSVPPTTWYQLWEYGTAAGNAGRGMWIDATGQLVAGLSGQAGGSMLVNAQGVCDGLWHFAVVTETNSGGTFTTRKLYLDGRLVSAAGGASLGTVTLGGALGARIGATVGGTNFFLGSMGGFFIGTGFLISENVRELYNKVNTGSILSDRQPMDPSACVERADSTNVYWIGDDLEPTDYVELMCA